MSLVRKVPSDTSFKDLAPARNLLDTNLSIVDKVPEEIFANQDLLEKNARLLSQNRKDPGMLQDLDANLTRIRNNFKISSEKIGKFAAV